MNRLADRYTAANDGLGRRLHSTSQSHNQERPSHLILLSTPSPRTPEDATPAFSTPQNPTVAQCSTHQNPTVMKGRATSLSTLPESHSQEGEQSSPTLNPPESHSQEGGQSYKSEHLTRIPQSGRWAELQI